MTREQRQWAWLWMHVEDGALTWGRWKGPPSGLVNIADENGGKEFAVRPGSRLWRVPTETGGVMWIAPVRDAFFCRGWEAARCDGWFFFSWLRHWVAARLQAGDSRAQWAVAAAFKRLGWADYRRFDGEQRSWRTVFGGLRR